MGHTAFYGLKDDIQSVFEFLFTQTDVAVFESHSEFDRELRQFRSLEELEVAFTLGLDRGASGAHAIFRLWSPSVMARPVPHRIDLKVEGHSFRYSIVGAGLIQLSLGGLHEESITYSQFSHWNEAGYQSRGPAVIEACDWRALSRLSGRIQRHIRRHLAVAKLGGISILPHAFAELERGRPLLCSGQLHHADSSYIQRVAA